MNTQQSGKAAVHIQVDPLAAMHFLTSTGANAFNVPRRAQDVSYLQDLMTGDFKPDDFVAGDKALATINLDRPLFETYNWLLELDCRFNLRVNSQCSGLRSVKPNFEIVLLLVQSIFEGGEIDTLSIATDPAGNAVVNTSAPVKSLLWTFLRKLQGARQPIASTQDVNDVHFLPAQCYNKCAIYRGAGQVGYAALDTDYAGIYGDTVLKTINFGATWTPTTQGPFTVLGRNAARILAIPTGGYEHRVIAFGGPMAATYPEASYSDGTRDTSGDLWTNVEVAAGAGHGGVGLNDVALDSIGIIWVAADGGHIYRSDDIGETYSVSENAQETNEDVNAIAFYGTRGYAVCDNNVVLLKLADSANWNALVGPVVGANLISVEVNYMGYIFVGTNGGQAWRSYDGGQTWVQVADNIPAVGSIDRIKADPELAYVMYLLHNDAAPNGIIYRSEDGGVSFAAENMTAMVNNGLYALSVINANSLYVGGDIVGTTGYIGKMESRG